MAKTVTLVTNQYRCDRIICAARLVADETDTELTVVGVLGSEYELNPQAIDYLFNLSKQNKATMRLFFSDDKKGAIHNIISQHDCRNVVTGMPSSNQSVLYELWKRYPGKTFYAVDTTGELVEVASSSFCTA